MAWSHPLIGLLLASGFTLGVACNDPFSSSSAGGESDTEAVCPVGSVGCPCTGGGSCDPGLLCASMRCVDPDQDPTTSTAPSASASDTSAATTEGESSTDDTTTGVTCDVSGIGAADPSCPLDQRYCIAGACFDCGAIDCAELSPSLPFCDVGTGLCAACLCDAKAPVCDPVTNTCSKCEAHSQCPDSACDLESGACLPAEATLWVGGGTCSDEGPGKAVPLCTLDEAFARVRDGAATSVALRVKAGDYAASATLHVPGGRVLALVPANDMQDGLAMIRITVASGPALVVDPQARLLLEGVELAKSSGDGLGCEQAAMWLDRLVIRDAKQRGMANQGCTVRMRRSLIVGNATAGVHQIGGVLRMENSFVSDNGNFEVAGGGVYLGAGASFDAVYSTFIDNLAAAGNPFSVACDADAPKEKVTVRNSVVVNKGLNTLCDGASVLRSAWTASNPQSGNITVDSNTLDKHLTKDLQVLGVYRAIPGSPLEGLALWKDGDPRVDFDGDLRPSDHDSPDVAGADRAAM